VKTFTCTYCKASYTEIIPAIGGKEASAVTWEEYQKMTGVEKDEFFASFSSSSAFVEWKKKAQADYQAGQIGIQTIGSGGTINLQ